MYDLIIRNGTLIDPAQGINTQKDIALTGGRVAAVIDPGSGVAAKHTLDVRGLYVLPGLIDLHVHVFSGVSHYGIDVDPTCLARGVTTVLDAGSSGALTFPGFRKFIIDVSQTRLYALLNISAMGMVSGSETIPPLGELEDLRYSNVETAVRMIEANRDRILGVKVRLSNFLAADGKNELQALLRAREAAEAVRLPLMVHSPLSSIPTERILDELRPGDILTHCVHGHGAGGIMSDDLKVLPAVRKKVEQGLRLDVGHGRGSFTFRVARAVLEQGVFPGTISSDLHTYNLHGPVFDLVTTMDKFLHIGMELYEVVRRVTSTPAEVLGMPEEIGTLKPGAYADIVVLEMQEGEFDLTDTFGVTETGQYHLEPRYIFRGGRQVGVLPRPESSGDYFQPPEILESIKP
ncbi:MAG: amidohydrolase/deacetylase family metallohydrolase [Bryobacterales bacterium]|nr:amidohydrolase/deacetylase family metallohydrolase [Bryobacterales bacterium]